MTIAPRRVLGLRDVVLFLVVAVVGTRWIAVAAAVGPAALTLWLIALVAMFVPLAFAVMELSSRWPDEGGLYVWTRRAFGDFSGFIAAWMYWASCLVYFPGLLYFVASNALFVAGPRGAALADSAAWHMGAALVGLALALLPNLLGVTLGKHLHNAGAFGSWLPVALLGVMAAVCATRFGPATEISAATLAPVAGARDLALWSALAFAFGGLEASSLMAGEIVDPRRTLPRAILIGGLLITAIYVGGTLSVLIAIPASEASGLQGLMQAIERASSRLGWGWVAPVAAALLTLGGIGMAGAWLAATARLPFVAGVDRALPAAFGRLHPRWGTPHIALLVQAAAAAVFAVLGQAGESVQGAYDVLVSMCVVTYFIPFLFLFAALIRVQREPAGAGVMRVPGGAPAAVALGLLGLATTLGGIALAVVPPAGSANPAIAVLKVVGANAVLLVVGAVLYRGARARAARPS